MSSRRSTKLEHLPPTLVRLIEAAEDHGGDAGAGRNISSAAASLREFGDLALWALPLRGAFVSDDERVAAIVERVAVRHLGLGQAKREFRKAMATIDPFDRRDAIESAHNQIRSVADEAYFYAGLAFGITMTATR